MKKIINKVKQGLLILVSFVLGTSCDHMLDIDSKENVDSDQLYQSVRYFEYGVVGVYNHLHLEYSALLGSILSDECKLSNENAGVDGYAVQLNRWTYSSDDDLLHNTWKDYYHTLYKINTLLENMPRVPQTTTDEQETMRVLEGELKGLRALVHFELHRIFGDSDALGNQAQTVPYVQDTNLFKKPGKTPLDEFYVLLWDDLNVAEDQITNANTPTRFSLDATKALAARVALYKKDYVKAIAYTTLIIDNYPLATKSQFLSLWQNNQTTEVIFKLARNNDDELRPNTLWYNFNTGKTLFYASSKLTKEYSSSDIRATAYLGTEQFPTIAKYSGEDNVTRISDLPVFRSAEMYLIRAEAYWHTGAHAQATTDIETLQQARITADTKRSNIDEASIFVERYKELPFEGHRYFDHKRLGKNIERQHEDLAATTDLQTLIFSNPLYQLPIPLKEVQGNPNLNN